MGFFISFIFLLFFHNIAHNTICPKYLNTIVGIVKTYNLAFIECETLQAVFSKDMTPNALTAYTK